MDDLRRGLVFLGQLHKSRLPNVPLQSPKMNSCQWTQLTPLKPLNLDAQPLTP